MPTSEPFYEHLPCNLDSRELVLKSKALAELLSEKDHVEQEKKDANAEFKQRLDDLETRLNALAVEVRTGKEYRDVPCIERADWADNRVEVIRTDNGEVVRIRPLQQGERQEALPYAKAKASSVARAEELIDQADVIIEKQRRRKAADNDNARREPDEFEEKLQ